MKRTYKKIIVVSSHYKTIEIKTNKKGNRISPVPFSVDTYDLADHLRVRGFTVEAGAAFAGAGAGAGAAAAGVLFARTRTRRSSM